MLGSCTRHALGKLTRAVRGTNGCDGARRAHALRSPRGASFRAQFNIRRSSWNFRLWKSLCWSFFDPGGPDKRYREMTPDERVRIAASMYDTARAIVLSSLPAGLSRRERRLAFARRFYEGELPEAALIAYAEWGDATGSQ